MGIAAIPNGKYGFTFEQEIGGVFAIEAGGGLTGRNFFGNIFAEALAEEKESQSSPNFADYLDYEDNDFEFTSRNATLGWFVSVMPRFYFLGDGIEDSYLGLNIQYRRYKFDAYQ